jgi:hypothetical protein
MQTDGRAALERELRDAPPEGVAALDPRHLEQLAALIRDARHRQAAELESAGEQALSYIPRPLRGPVRRLAR